MYNKVKTRVSDLYAVISLLSLSVLVAQHDPESIITEAQTEYSTAQGDIESSFCSTADVSFQEKNPFLASQKLRVGSKD